MCLLLEVIESIWIVETLKITNRPKVARAVL